MREWSSIKSIAITEVKFSLQSFANGLYSRVYFVSVDYISITACATETFFAKLWTDVYPSRMPPIGAKLCQNAFQTIPNIWFFDAPQFFFSKLWTAVYPPRMAPIGAKLCQNAFQTIPDIWFFDARKNFWMRFSDQKWSIKSKIARFGGATHFWVLPTDCPRKMTPFPQKIKSLRSLAKGFKNDFRFFHWLLDQSWLTVFLRG